MDNPIFPTTGLVRLSQILSPPGPIPVSKSTWWQGVKDGRFPQPQKLGPRTTVWKVEDTSVITTVNAYCPVSIERQAELIKN